MFCCSVCCKEFKTNWHLRRHSRKKNICVVNVQEQYKTQENTEESQENTQNKGHIYVIWTREFKTQNLPIYKIGRTSQNITNKGTCKRLEQYPKYSEQVMCVVVDNCFAAETELMNEL